MYIKKEVNMLSNYMLMEKNVRFETFDDEDEAGKVAMEKAREYGKAI